MAYTRLTLKQIYDRVMANMESRTTGGAKIPTTSLLSVIGFGISGGSFMMQGFIDWVYRQILPDLADEVGIGRWSRIYKLPQKAAEFTTGVVAFTGVNGTTVAQGTEIQNEEALAYTTQAPFVIGIDTDVDVEANEAGADWNVTGGLELVQPETGVDDIVTLVSGFDDGADLETFANWVLRILQRTQNPPSSGTVADYERWALEATASVVYSWCFPAENWMGAGTVGLAVSGEDFAELSAGVVTEVDTYVKSVRAIPAGELTTYTPLIETIDYEISITPNTAEVQAAVTANLEDLYKSDAAPDGTMYISRTRSAISAGGASNYVINDIEKDGGTTIPVADFYTDKLHVPVLGTIDFSAVP